MANLTDKDYDILVKKASPNSNSAFTIPMAFLVGGLICTIGEGLINLYLHMGMEKELAYPAASITLVFVSAVLTGLHLYDDIAKFAGAGTLVPITGFANAVTAPAIEFKSEGYVLGIGSKMFVIAGPVLVYGLSAGIFYGLIVFMFHLY